MPLRLDASIAATLRQLSSAEIELQKIRAGWPGPKPESALAMRIGPMASGAAVIANKQLANEVKTHWRKLLGIDMETYGVFYAAQHGSEPKASVFSMKSVTDFADSKKSDEWREYAEYTSAAALNLLVHALFFD